MERIGVRQLQQHASSVLRRVGAGETLEITARGRPVAVLSSQRGHNALESLRRAGRVDTADGDVLALGLPLAKSGAEENGTQRLARHRNRER